MRWTLEALLDEHELSQSDLARLVNVSPGSISRWVNGGVMSLRAASDICDLFDLTLDQLDQPIGRDCGPYQKSGHKRPKSKELIAKLRGQVRSDVTRERIARGILIAHQSRL